MGTECCVSGRKALSVEESRRDSQERARGVMAGEGISQGSGHEVMRGRFWRRYTFLEKVDVFVLVFLNE